MQPSLTGKALEMKELLHHACSSGLPSHCEMISIIFAADLKHAVLPQTRFVLRISMLCQLEESKLALLSDPRKIKIEFMNFLFLAIN